MPPPIQIIRRKLLRPRLTDEYVRRPRLLDQLNQGLDRRVTLVSAPAGFGKSTLLAQWLDQAPSPFAWLTLDQDDNDLRWFNAYFTSAIQTIYPGSLQESSNLTRGRSLNDPARLAKHLKLEIGLLPGKFILVLDDYHTIRDSSVNALMSTLLRQIPEKMHLVIASRNDPPLPFPRLRTSGNLSELRARDLRLTSAEANEYLRLALHRDLEPEAANLLHAQIEGWAVGMRFACMLLQEGGNPQTTLENLVNGRRPPLVSYMLDEVLAHMRPVLRELILKTALLDRFSAGIGSALLKDMRVESSSAVLQELLRNDILLEIPGDSGSSYRYHSLFAAFLRTQALSRLDSETIARVHRIAGKWYESRGMITESIRQLVAAGDVTSAAGILYRNLHPALNGEAGRSLLELWLSLFPAEALDREIELLVARIWLAGIQFRAGAISALTTRAEQVLAENTQLSPRRRRRLKAELTAERFALLQWSNQGQRAIELAGELYDKLPPEADFVRANMLLEIGLAEQMVGNTQGALERLTRELRANISPQFNRRMLIALCAVYMNSADLYRANETAESLLHMSHHASPLSRLWAHYYLGLIHYEWNHLETAAQHFSAATELRFHGNSKAGHESLAMLAQSRMTLGQHDLATAAMQDLMRFTEELESGEFEYHFLTHRARQSLLSGKLDSALRWADSVILNPQPHMVFEVETNLTRLHILLATQDRERITTILRETDALLTAARSLHSTRRVIQVLALRAVARDILGDRGGALESLQESLRLAEPGSMVRTYLDVGPRMMSLIGMLSTRSASSQYVDLLLAANPQRVQSKTPAVRNPKQLLIEPLTHRELQVLERLAMRLSDKEIAQALVISPLTVKAHTDHIYQKLGVNNRLEAVKVGVEYGILERPSNTPLPVRAQSNK